MHAQLPPATKIDSSTAATDTQSVPKTGPVIRPDLRSVMRAIRSDASRDAVKYLLRSDTGHDGE
jgi:hypothetical protein